MKTSEELLRNKMSFWTHQDFDSFTGKILEVISECQVDFANWINNNWYEPAEDGMWRIRIEHPEYSLPIPEVNIFSTEDLLKRFINKEGEF